VSVKSGQVQSAKSEQAELTRLRKEVTTLRMERDILKSRGLLC
jgi:transposase-like protein